MPFDEHLNGHKQPSMAHQHHSMLSRCKQSCQALLEAFGEEAQLLARHPHVVILPLLVLAALLTGGILGVQYSIQAAYENARAAAGWSAQVQVRSVTVLAPVLIDAQTLYAHSVTGEG